MRIIRWFGTVLIVQHAFSRLREYPVQWMLNNHPINSSMTTTNLITPYVRTHYSYVFLLALNSIFSPDDPEVFNNAPVGLQLIGGTLEEEAVLAMTEVVDRALTKNKPVTPQL